MEKIALFLRCNPIVQFLSKPVVKCHKCTTPHYIEGVGNKYTKVVYCGRCHYPIPELERRH